jgi:hypothetical protein
METLVRLPIKISVLDIDEIAPFVTSFTPNKSIVTQNDNTVEIAIDFSENISDIDVNDFEVTDGEILDLNIKNSSVDSY